MLLGKLETDNLDIIGEQAQTFTVGAYCFLIVLEMPTILNEEEKKIFQKFLEYQFRGLQWKTFEKGDIIENVDIYLQYTDINTKSHKEIHDKILIDKNKIDDKENVNKSFKILYFITTDTCLKVTHAYYLTNCYLVDVNIEADDDAPISPIYVGRNLYLYKYDYIFNCMPFVSDAITKDAVNILSDINNLTIIKESGVDFKSLLSQKDYYK